VPVPVVQRIHHDQAERDKIAWDELAVILEAISALARVASDGPLALLRGASTRRHHSSGVPHPPSKMRTSEHITLGESLGTEQGIPRSAQRSVSAAPKAGALPGCATPRVFPSLTWDFPDQARAVCPVRLRELMIRSDVTGGLLDAQRRRSRPVGLNSAPRRTSPRAARGHWRQGYANYLAQYANDCAADGVTSEYVGFVIETSRRRGGVV
jgi:hypothetical protein